MAKLERAPLPVYPATMEARGQEGWVTLSFVVDADGRVIDPIVEDSSGQPEFERAALKAAARQRYTPATVDGTPVEQCATQVLYRFAIPGMQSGARKEFRERFIEAQKHIDSGDRDTATRILEEMLEACSLNNYESTRLHLLRYDLCEKYGELDCMLESIRRAESGDGAYMEPDLYREVLQATAAVEIKAELYRDALTTIEKRNKLKPPLPDNHPLRLAAAEILDQMNSDKNLVFSGKIGFRTGCDVGAPNWRHQLLRREFSVDAVQGKLDKLEIRCDWRRTTDVISPDKAWKVPANWGNCQVFVFGDSDATLRLVEYPLIAGDKGATVAPD